jgi:RNA polymerase sigma-70 factor (ECF subfamily)
MDVFEGQIPSVLPRLRRFAHALSRNTPDADDLTQSTIERALRSKLQWKPGTRLDSWLFTIMRNLWIDKARSRTRRQRFEAQVGEVGELAADPGDELEKSIELRRVMGAMEQLPDNQREVVSLILIEGFGHRETAEMLDLPIGTVSSRLARGRTALLELLGGR